MEPSCKQNKLDDDNEYETRVLQRLERVASLPSSFVCNPKWDTDYVVNIIEYLAPKISPELAWTEQMKSRKANGPANVMKTLKACNLEGYLNIVAIKRIASEHNRKKFLKLLDLIADIIEKGSLPKSSTSKTQKLFPEMKTEESTVATYDDKTESDVPSPFQKKEKLRRENDHECQQVPTNHKGCVKTSEDMKISGHIIADTNFSIASQAPEKPLSLQERTLVQDHTWSPNDEDDIDSSQDCETMKPAIPTPFRSSRPREFGENAPVQVISSPTRVFQDFLQKSGVVGKVEMKKSLQNTSDIQEQLEKTHKEFQPPRRKIMMCKNELKKLKKTAAVDNTSKQVGQNGKSNCLDEKKETMMGNSINTPMRTFDKENHMEVGQQECTPKKKKQSHVVQTSPIVRATDPSRGNNSWIKAQNSLEEMIEEVMVIMNCIDISYQVFPMLLDSDTNFLPLIESRLEDFNDSLQNLRKKLEQSLQEVNQYLEKGENISLQRDIADFIKEIAEEYSSPSIQSLPYLQRKLDSLRQDYFHIQNQNALALVLYANETDKKLTWSTIEESFLPYEQVEGLSNSLLGFKEILMPRNLIVSSGKRLEKTIHKKFLYKKSAYSVFL